MKFVKQISYAQWAGVAVSSVGLFFTYKKITPSPSLYNFAEYNTSYSPYEYSYPKFVIRLENAGLGPMYIHSMKIFDKNDKIVNPAYLLSDCKTAVVTNYNIGNLSILNGNKDLITFRPARDAKKDTEGWYVDVSQTLQNRGFRLEISYGLTKWKIFSKKEEIPLVPAKQ